MKFLLILVLAGIAALSYFKGPLIVLNMGDTPAQTVAQPQPLVIDPPSVPIQPAPARVPQVNSAPQESANVYRCTIQGRVTYSQTPCAPNASTVSNRLMIVPHIQTPPVQAQPTQPAQQIVYAAPTPPEQPAFYKCAPYTQQVEAAHKALQYSNQYNNAVLHQQLRNAQSQLDDCEFASR